MGEHRAGQRERRGQSLPLSGPLKMALWVSQLRTDGWKGRGRKNCPGSPKDLQDKDLGAVSPRVPSAEASCVGQCRAGAGVVLRKPGFTSHHIGCRRAV